MYKNINILNINIIEDISYLYMIDRFNLDKDLFHIFLTYQSLILQTEYLKCHEESGRIFADPSDFLYLLVKYSP